MNSFIRWAVLCGMAAMLLTPLAMVQTAEPDPYGTLLKLDHCK